MSDFTDNAKSSVGLGHPEQRRYPTLITFNAAEPIDPNDPTEPPFVDLNVAFNRDGVTVEGHEDLRLGDIEDLIEALTAARDRALQWAEKRGWCGECGSEPDPGTYCPGCGRQGVEG